MARSGHTHKPRRSFWRDNGLSIVLFALFLIFWSGQAITGWLEENHDREDHGRSSIELSEYLSSGAFLEVTAENWESEFLQMCAYVLLTVTLFQRGSAESKSPDKREEVDRQPKPSADAPGPVRAGGLALKLYERSLGLTFFMLFAIAFILHAIGGAANYNEEQLEHGGQTVSIGEYLMTSRFWFESFQNWQSEFLAIGAMVVLSIFLRQRGSPESKPVDAPHSENE
jgi:hypothetical protein